MVEKLDYERLGLKVGLEIHVQLNTRRKLFCHCPTLLVEEGNAEVFERYLRPAKSETGEVDPAALLEWRKNRKYVYQSPVESSCLVEADEEPPHEIDKESLITALAVSKSLNMRLVDEIYVMRKIVLDGSNVSGFQRTALIAINGYLNVEGRRIRIQTLCLEEDAARKIDEAEDKATYRLDRLGIPLIEIATAPDIRSPEEAAKVALRIGQLVKLTGRAKRGLGTVRQDLNISIAGGAKVEIKGVQYLDIIPTVIEYEVQRQLILLEIRDELLRRGVKKSDLEKKIVDVTDILKNTESKLVKRALAQPNSAALAVLLPGFKGILGKEVQPGRRFGTELADYARVWGKVGGLLHSDELPGYGITIDIVEKIYSALGGDSSRDAFVLIIDEKTKAERGLEAVVDRAIYALTGVPEETRAANPDGTTKYMRPRPGSARMYPETDIPPIVVTEELIHEAATYVPENPEARLERYMKQHGLSAELASKIIDSVFIDLYEEAVAKFSGKLPASVIASTLVNTIPALRREGVNVDRIGEEELMSVFSSIAEGIAAKEAIPDILRYLAQNPGASVREAVEKLGLKKIGIDDLDNIIEEVIRANTSKILEKKTKAFQIVMSEVMARVRGRIDGSVVSERVRNKLKIFLEQT